MSSARPKVILRHCDEYDADRIGAIVAEGLRELDLRPTGRVLVKPNLVIALEGLFEHSFTRPELLDGLLGALLERADDGLLEVAVGERCGITMPTRLAYDAARYPEVVAKHNVARYFFDEVTQVPVQLRHPDRLRDVIYVPEPVVEADFFVNVPKFKAHPWTTVTFGAKNYIGLQDDRHRLIDHDHRLDEKVADLQELVQPKFLCVDAIIAGHERMMTPPPFPLHLIIMGNNQPAVDAVCCQILGLDPHDVAHIRLCAERGYGPIDLEAIELSGDVSLAAARQRAQGFKVGRVRVEDYFADTPITALAGPPPEPEHTDYCWGGCPGAIEEAIEVIRKLQPDAYDRMRPMTLVFGAYDGPIEPRDGEKVVFMGDCCRWQGRLGGTSVDVRSCYVDRQRIRPCDARMNDIFVKMIATYAAIFSARHQPLLRITGCPVSVAEQILVMATLGRTRNPYFAPATVVPFVRGWLGWRWARLARWLLGKPYQIDGSPRPAKATPMLAEPSSGSARDEASGSGH